MFDYCEISSKTALLLCSSRDLNKCFQKVVEYLSTLIPLDGASIAVYNQELHAMEHLAIVINGETIDKPAIAALPPEVPNNYHFFKGDAYIFTEHKRGDMPKEYFKELDIRGKNDLAVKIEDRGMVVAFVIFRANSPTAYSEDHLNLMKVLRPTFTLAILKHLQIRKLEIDNDRIIAKNSIFRYSRNKELSQNIACAHSGLKQLFEIAGHVAKMHTTVLISGETGVGKEVFANHIHNNSNYCKGPLIKVNCGAIPENLIDIELFGHEKGAFTGADSAKKGKFELANMGTIFLDEIGELPLLSQVKLLRAIQFKEIERIGGHNTIKINVRIICATNKNLREMMHEEKFREDLYYRISVFPIEIPPVRARRNDIPELIYFILSKKCGELGIKDIPAISLRVMDKLQAYSWPGNVREMENTIERELIINKKPELSFKHFLDDKAPPHQPKGKEHIVLNDVIYNHIRHILHKTNGKIHGKGGAAELLEMNPSTLRSMIKRLEKFH